MHVGIIGGTFDPPHFGHLILAEQAREQLALKRVIWVPAADPPHKLEQVITPIEHRLEMVRLAVADNLAFEVSLVDVERLGPHYTVDMLKALAAQNPTAVLFLLVGSDSLRDLPTWHEPSHLTCYAKLAVMRRAGVTYDLDELGLVIPKLRENIVFVDAPLLEISAHRIRERVAGGRTIRYLLPADVAAYIREQGLYTN